ncbi:hypothetical protein AAG589_02385 [Isoptericola sp. F-RaC21]|uniref:membrane protein YczE n=1 Tax=Isoptericola sp. F-RaC21 TaxID=3141452 RepID=UPI00315BE985
MSTTSRPVRRPRAARRPGRRLHRRPAAGTGAHPAPSPVPSPVPRPDSGAAPSAPPATAMGPVRRGVQLVLGLLGFAWSMAMMLHAGEGGMPWDVLHQGLVRSTGLGFGGVVALTAVLVLLAWIPLRQRPGIGTLANVVLISVAIGPSLTAMERLVPDPALAARVVLAVGGIVLNGVATAAYIGVRLGPGPRDGLMTGLVQRTGWSVRLVKTGIEVSVVLVGVLLGGTFGWATIAYALGVGPVVQATVRWRWLVPAGLTGEAPRSRRRPAGDVPGREHEPAARPADGDRIATRGREIADALDAIAREHRDH